MNTESLIRRQLLGGLLASGLLPVARSQGTQPHLPSLRVVASFSILADMLGEVGGSAVEVTALVGPNADAHVFEPSPADVQRVARADLVVVNGLGFEGWIDRLIRASGYRGAVVVATAGIQPRRVDGVADPHAWQSLALAQRYIENLRSGLAKVRPTQAALFDAQAADYQRRVSALHQSVLARAAAVPVADRRVITSHDAFGYFADAYGVEFRAPQGWSTASQASAADVARIVRQLKAQRVRALFVENISDPRLLARVASEAGARVGGTLYSDALSPPGTAGDTYLRMFEHNVATLLAALQPSTQAATR